MSVFKQGLPCFGSLHWFRILGTWGHCTCLYPPKPQCVYGWRFAALPVLRRRHSKDTCCWAGASTVMRCSPQKHNFDVIQCVVLGIECALNRCDIVKLSNASWVDDWGLLSTWRQWRSSWKLEMYLFSWLKQPSAKVCWPDTDRIVPCQRHGNILHVGIWGIHWCRIWNFPWAWICSWPPVALVSD